MITLERFLLRRCIYYVSTNVLFNFLIAYASFNELGYTHFFAGSQSLARLSLPMAVFLPVVFTLDVTKRIIQAIDQGRIALSVDPQLNANRFMLRHCVLYGCVSGLSLLAILLAGQYFLSVDYKLDMLWMAILDGCLAGLLSFLFTYLPAHRLRKYLLPK